jgi:hypothetical protein
MDTNMLVFWERCRDDSTMVYVTRLTRNIFSHFFKPTSDSFKKKLKRSQNDLKEKVKDSLKNSNFDHLLFLISLPYSSYNSFFIITPVKVESSIQFHMLVCET